MALAARHNPLHTSHDRLGFAVCVALTVHAAFILGVTFNREDRTPPAPKLEITLAQSQSDTPPKEADYAAQFNQEGSGSLEEKAKLTTRQLADFQDTVIREIDPLEEESSAPQQEVEKLKAITTTRKSTDTLEQDKEKPSDKPEEETGNDTQLNRLSMEIASLEAQLDKQKQTLAKKPRIHRLTSLSTREDKYAAYLYAWQAKVEAIGNKNYPAEASQKNLNADVRLAVTMRPDGRVKNVEVLQSSGFPFLDQAAIESVRRAAPFQAFPKAISQEADFLEIIRTWQFRQDRVSAVD